MPLPSRFLFSRETRNVRTVVERSSNSMADISLPLKIRKASQTVRSERKDRLLFLGDEWGREGGWAVRVRTTEFRASQLRGMKRTPLISLSFDGP